MKETRNKILYILAAIAVFYVIMNSGPVAQWVNSDRVGSDTVYVSDTVVQVEWREVVKSQRDTLYYPEYVDRYIDRVDTLEAPVYVYQDTVKVDDNFSVRYTAHVEGRIRSINFGVIGKYPVKTQVITNERTITNTMPNSGLYIGVFATSASTVGVGLDLIRGKNQFGVGYGLNNELVISYKRKIL